MRVGAGKRIGQGFVWTSWLVGGFITTCLAAIGVIGIIALMIGIFSR